MALNNFKIYRTIQLINLPLIINLNKCRMLIRHSLLNYCSCLDKAAIIREGDFDNMSGSGPNPWKLCSVTRVEEVKMVVRLLPIWATTIIFWTTYAQMITFSVEQASTMERSIGSFQIPAGSLTVFFVAAILITLAINDRFIMPLWRKWKGKQGIRNNHP